MKFNEVKIIPQQNNPIYQRPFSVCTLSQTQHMNHVEMPSKIYKNIKYLERTMKQCIDEN